MLKDVNIYLAQGLECRDVLFNYKQQITVLDSTVQAQHNLIDNQRTQLTLKDSNASIANQVIDDCSSDNARLTEANNKLDNKVKGWKRFGLTASAILAITIILTTTHK